jgi:hypothetical protein
MTAAALALVSGLPAACGGSSTPAAGTASQGAAHGSGGGSAGALSAEANSVATGDIPDNQVFLTFHDPNAGYSIVYPEGWAQRGDAGDVTFQDKNNIIHIVVSRGSTPAPATLMAALARQRRREPSLTFGSPTTMSIAGTPVLRVSYSTSSQPNPVTGKRVKLMVDRYVYSHAGKVATVDLGTPKGVDNVDAYRNISHSLRWR